jgi:hypothetical protein
MFIRNFIWALMILFFPLALPAQETPTAAPTGSPVPTETPSPKTHHPDRNKTTGSTQIIVVHKPQPLAAWGKVIQYKREEILALTEKNRETLHEFVFQDEEGIIRTATYHENASGDGFWEVWVWDLP